MIKIDVMLTKEGVPYHLGIQGEVFTEQQLKAFFDSALHDALEKLRVRAPKGRG
jgi:hypothetical protein